MRCDPTLLWTLVEQSSEPGDESLGLLEHVERCPSCQATLRSLGGNESWWSDVQKWLSENPPDAIRQPHSGGLSESTALDLSVLEPAKHPEMLGRLGRYDIVGVIGRGGMGVVFRGFDSDLQRCVAIKILSPHYGHDATARERFAREAQAAASVVHENVIPIFNVEAEHNPPFLVMPYIAGATLERFVQRYGRPDAITVLRIASQIASGLDAAHRLDLIHRDIKPGNILVTENVHRVWITDFGLARAVDNATLTHTGLIAGTPQFMSPEQSRGQRLDARSDLFSFGALLYFLSTGEPPFQGENTLAVLHQVAVVEPPSLAALRPDLPPSFLSLVTDLMHKQPARRPRNAGEVSKRITRAIAEMNSGTSAERLRRTRVVLAAAVSILLVCVLTAGLASFLRSRQEQAVSVIRSSPRPAPKAPTQPPSAPDPQIVQLVEMVDHELSQAATARTLERLEQTLVRLEQQPAVPGDFRLDWVHQAAQAGGRETAAAEQAVERLEYPEAQFSWKSIATDPAQSSAPQLRELSQGIEQLRQTSRAFP